RSESPHSRITCWLGARDGTDASGLRCVVVEIDDAAIRHTTRGRAVGRDVPRHRAEAVAVGRRGPETAMHAWLLAPSSTPVAGAGERAPDHEPANGSPTAPDHAPPFVFRNALECFALESRTIRPLEQGLAFLAA